MNGHTHLVTQDHRPQHSPVPVSSSRCLPGAGDGGTRQGCWSLAGYGKRALQTPLQQREHPQLSGNQHSHQLLASHSHPVGLVGSDHGGIIWCHLPTQAESSQILNKSLTMSVSPIPNSQLSGAHSAHPGRDQPLLLPRGASIKQRKIPTHIKQLAQLALMEPSGYHLPGPQLGEHLEQVQHREQQRCPNAPPTLGQPVARVPCPGDLPGSCRHSPTSPAPRNGDEEMLLWDGRSRCSP